MISKRVIPFLLHDKNGLVKTKQFRDPVYIGDPLNAIRIFNAKHVDELVLLDIGRSRDRKMPDFDFVSRVVSECFMPLGYGGGIRNVSDAKNIFSLGVEKVILQTSVLQDTSIIREISQLAGSQSVSISIDVIGDNPSTYKVFHSARQKVLHMNLIDLLKMVQSEGAGEVILTSIQREGTFGGYDLDLISYVREIIDIPLVINGGAGSIEDFNRASLAGVDATAAGSMFVFYKNRDGVLLNYSHSTNSIIEVGT